MIKNILFLCTGNSARSIIGEAIINNNYKDKFKAYSAGTKPTGIINPYIKKYLESKNYNLENYSSKNLNLFLDNSIKMNFVITVCNNSYYEICPTWPNKNQLIHWDIDDPVQRMNHTNDENLKKIISKNTFNEINLRIKGLINI